MRYWWVNQKKTYRHEVQPRGYLWSPKKKKNGARNQYYEFMREVAPGDFIFSHAKGHIKAIGRALTHAYVDLKPPEFGAAGAAWDTEGWRIDVAFRELSKSAQFRPQDYIERLRPHLPAEYPPLRQNGKGLELYLTHISKRFADELVAIGGEAASVAIADIARVSLGHAPELAKSLLLLEQQQVRDIESNPEIPPTEREAIIAARRGQGKFRSNLQSVEKACRLTGVREPEYLRASHCKPWRNSTDQERLDGNNGLLLTPNADHLFDRGFISFNDNGDLLVSPVAHQESLKAMGIDPGVARNVGTFTNQQLIFLQFHRDNVFLRAKPFKSKSCKR